MEETNIFKNKYLVPILAIFACLLWGSAFPSLKIGFKILEIGDGDTYLKILFAGYRFLLASLMLFAWRTISSNKKSIKINRKQLGFLFLLGLMQTSLQYIFFYIGMSNTTGVKGSILTTLGIFLTVTISHYIYKDDRLNFSKIFGLITGLIGVVIVNLSRGNLNFSFALSGEGLIILTAVTSTLAAIMVKNSSTQLDSLLVTAYQMFLGSIVLFLVAMTKVHPLSLVFTFKSFLLLLYLAFISAGGFGIWYSLIRYNRLGYISIYKFIIPVAGVLLSALFLPAESITINILFALLLVTLGIILINYHPGKFSFRGTSKESI